MHRFISDAYQSTAQSYALLTFTFLGETMNTFAERAIQTELRLRNALIKAHDSFFARLKDDRGDVPGWVLVVLMTTGLVTAIWTIAAPRLTAILKDSLDSMNGIR
jgi:hypothetical protein